MPDARLLTDLLVSNPHVMLCVKSEQGRYLVVNDAFVRRTTRRRAEEVIGRRAEDLFPRELALSYDAQDASVLRTGLPVQNHLEVIPTRDGTSRWYLTSKALHLRPDLRREIVVVSVDANLERDATARGLSRAIEFVQRNPSRRTSVPDLAAIAALSVDQFGLAMSRALGCSPKQYLLRRRVDFAARRLATTNDPIARIAREAGFYDQSQLARQFRARIGLTPREYRRAATRADETAEGESAADELR